MGFVSKIGMDSGHSVSMSRKAGARQIYDWANREEVRQATRSSGIMEWEVVNAPDKHHVFCCIERRKGTVEIEISRSLVHGAASAVLGDYITIILEKDNGDIVINALDRNWNVYDVDPVSLSVLGGNIPPELKTGPGVVSLMQDIYYIAHEHDNAPRGRNRQ